MISGVICDHKVPIRLQLILFYWFLPNDIMW